MKAILPRFTAILLLTILSFSFANARRIYVRDNSATTFYFTTAPGNDANPGTPSSPVATINRAITIANSGDSIYIDAGLYNENNSIDKGLYIFGANATISPNTGTRNMETILYSFGNTLDIITDEAVKISGIKFIANSGDAILGYASNTKVTLNKNLFETGEGIFLQNSDSVVLSDNRFRSLSPTTIVAAFIAGNYNGSTGTYLLAYDNVFENSNVPGINLINVKGRLYYNTFTNIGKYGIQVANKTSVQVTANVFNSITNPDTVGVPSYGAGIRFYTPSSGMATTITNNVFTNNYSGVSVRNSGGNMTGLNVHINSNSILGSTKSAINHGGTGNLDAACNWYGSTNMADISPKITGPVTWMPYLMSGTDNDAGTAGFQPQPNMCASTVLPVMFLSFNGKKLPGVNVLTWVISQAIAGSEIELERSSAGNAFTKIAWGNGSSEFRDIDYPQAINNYRLKITDPSGTVKYSTVVSLNNSKSGMITIGPNPFVDHVTIQPADALVKDYSVQLFDSRGSLVRKHNLVNHTGSITLRDLSSLAKGFYVLEISDGESREVYRLKK